MRTFSMLALTLICATTRLTHAQSAYVAESIPSGMNLPMIGYKSTADALIEIAEQSKYTLDVTAMYFNLLAQPNRSSFGARLQELGAHDGARLYKALVEACKRGVVIRLLTSTWTKQLHEAESLKKACPDFVIVRAFDPKLWFNGGIMHAKVWSADDKDVYIGSANMDWLSLTQVKELGIVIKDAPAVALDTKKLFNTWWHLAALKPDARQLFSDQYQTMRTLPCWSASLVEKDRCENPLAARAYETPFNAKHPMKITLNGEPGNLFISNSPREISGKGREWDLDGIIHTMRDALSRVDMSVMDFVPASLYLQPQSVWWSELSDTILQLVTTKKIKVRLIVSRWATTHARMMPYLKNLQALASVCTLGSSDRSTPCEGSFEIRVFEVPGWEDTRGQEASFPPFSRVNHGKYVVTDRRTNVGTSNWTWDYFYNTVGTSLNLDHEGIRRSVADIFERDWNSPYTSPLL